MPSVLRRREPDVPDHNPLLASAAWEDLPAGSDVTFLLGEMDSPPRGRRAVRGRAVGFQVRGPFFMDVVLEAMTTWIHDAPPRGVEVLPPYFSSHFRVRIAGTVRATLRILRGQTSKERKILSAVEYPLGSCWKCGGALEGGVFCSGCGRRVSVGYPTTGWPRARFDPKQTCPVCWFRAEGADGYCRHCGYDRALPARLTPLEGRHIQIELREGRAEKARMSGRLQGVRYERILRSSEAQLLGRVDMLRLEDSSEHLDPSFQAFLSLKPSGQTVESVIRAIEADEPVRASEMLERCFGCTDWSAPHASPFLRGRHCTICGRRGRIFPHPSWSARHRRNGPETVELHACGAWYLPGKDAFCGHCGVSIRGGAMDTGGGRFSRLL